MKCLLEEKEINQNKRNKDRAIKKFELREIER